jgi:acyl-CoA thioester hydrolase
MSRIKIDLPEKFIFSTAIPIRLSDINGAKHLGHDRVLPIMERARVQLLDSLGLAGDVMGGAAFIVVDAGIIYKKQGFYGMTLKVEVAVTDFTNKGCDIVFLMSNAATGEEIVRGKTGVLFFDYGKQKVVEVPEVFRKKVAERQV